MATYDIAKEATLPEILRTKAPDGSYMGAIDVLSAGMPLLEEGYWIQANDDTSHEFLRTTSEPNGAPVRYGEGGPWEMGTQVPVKEQLMRLETNLKIDTRILKKAPDPVRYRRDKEAQTVRGLVKTFHNIAFSKTMLLQGVSTQMGNAKVDPKQVDGLGVRYGALAANSVVSLGGSGATLSSLWIVKNGPEGLFYLYPKSEGRAFSEEDNGEIPTYDANGNPFKVLWTNWSWEFGFGIGDPRNVKRLCNISTSGAGSFFDDTDKEKGEKALIDLIEALPGGDTTGVTIYAGGPMIAQMRKRLNSKSNLYFNTQDVWGRKMLTFMEVPIVRLDVLGADESTIS